MSDLRPEDFENLGDGAPRPWSQPGGYIARWLGGEIRLTPWGEKLYFRWRIYLTLSLDERDSIVVYRYHDLKRDGGGRFVFGALHSYRRDWIAANRGKYPSRFNSLPYSVFEDKNILVELRTVETSAGGVLIHSSCHYSTIRRVVRPVEEGESFTTYPLELLKERGKSNKTLGEGGRVGLGIGFWVGLSVGIRIRRTRSVGISKRVSIRKSIRKARK